ncbi:hypothetical protein MSG28_002959 [Choristoneura fumiferana]|uniref:Uncharacterized protein n=1 Tax=Choristoneura fumiferana TaxID=7141 RepID=A0ACC0JK38_CHOFU|nr:hypothetical protein MSG28_002959 [Choristoneura fumiferana]
MAIQYVMSMYQFEVGSSVLAWRSGSIVVYLMGFYHSSWLVLRHRLQSSNWIVLSQKVFAMALQACIVPTDAATDICRTNLPIRESPSVASLRDRLKKLWNVSRSIRVVTEAFLAEAEADAEATSFTSAEADAEGANEQTGHRWRAITVAHGHPQHEGNHRQVVGPCARFARIATTILLANPAVKQQCLHCCVSVWRPIYVPLLGTGLLSEQEGLGHSSHAGPVRIGNFTRTIELLRSAFDTSSLDPLQYTPRKLNLIRNSVTRSFCELTSDESAVKRQLHCVVHLMRPPNLFQTTSANERRLYISRRWQLSLTECGRLPMVRNYKKKTSRGDWSEENMNAVKNVVEGKMGYMRSRKEADLERSIAKKSGTLASANMLLALQKRGSLSSMRKASLYCTRSALIARLSSQAIYPCIKMLCSVTPNLDASRGLERNKSFPRRGQRHDSRKSFSKPTTTTTMIGNLAPSAESKTFYHARLKYKPASWNSVIRSGTDSLRFFKKRASDTETNLRYPWCWQLSMGGGDCFPSALQEDHAFQPEVGVQEHLLVLGVKKSENCWRADKNLGSLQPTPSCLVDVLEDFLFRRLLFQPRQAITSTYECQIKIYHRFEKPLLRRIRQETQRVIKTLEMGRKDMSDSFARSAVADINAGGCTPETIFTRDIRSALSPSVLIKQAVTVTVTRCKTEKPKFYSSSYVMVSVK